MPKSIKEPKKASSVRHTRAIALDRSKRPNGVAPAADIQQLLQEVIQPATFNTVAYYQKLGLRARTLTLPVMVAFVLSLIWRQIGSVAEAVRVLNEEGMLWQPPVKVTQQAVNERLHEMPAEPSCLNISLTKYCHYCTNAAKPVLVPSRLKCKRLCVISLR